MKSSLPVLLLLPVLLISLGMYTYTSSQSTISDSMREMSNMEIEAFNTQFTVYEGEQTGAKLKSLMGTLIANANAYKEEPYKLPEVTAEIIDLDSDDDEEQDVTVLEAKTPEKSDKDSLQDYVDLLTEIRSSLENKHNYQVSFGYNSDGIVNKIIIER